MHVRLADLGGSEEGIGSHGPGVTGSSMLPVKVAGTSTREASSQAKFLAPARELTSSLKAGWLMGQDA